MLSSFFKFPVSCPPRSPTPPWAGLRGVNGQTFELKWKLSDGWPQMDSEVKPGKLLMKTKMCAPCRKLRAQNCRALCSNLSTKSKPNAKHILVGLYRSSLQNAPRCVQKNCSKSCTILGIPWPHFDRFYLNNVFLFIFRDSSPDAHCPTFSTGLCTDSGTIHFN